MTEKRFILTEQFNGLQGVTFVKDECVDVDTYYTVDGAVDLLNDLSEENDVLKQQLKTKYIVNKQYEELQRLKQENEQLKIKLEDITLEIENAKESNDDAQYELYKIKKENEQLKKRNENQYKQLNNLWGLIQAKDWETLTAMDNQMKEDEERLQQEWKCY